MKQKGNYIISTKSGNESLISKTIGSSNTRKKVLTTSLQVRHLLLQSLNACINGIHSRLNLLYEEGSGNPTQVVQHELYSKAHSNQLLDCSPPLQDPLGRNSVDKLCSMSFITHPNNFKNCSLAKRPRRNPHIKSPWLL